MSPKLLKFAYVLRRIEVFSLTYVSSAIEPFSNRELRELLEISNLNNRLRGVTGMLLYKDGNFMQVLEGEQRTVLAVHAIIARDARHRGLITLMQAETPGRQFPTWSMGFRDLGADIDNPPGYTEFLNLPLNDTEFTTDPTKAQKLLLMFKKAMSLNVIRDLGE